MLYYGHTSTETTVSQLGFPSLNEAHVKSVLHQMKETGKAVLYLRKEAGTYEIVDYTETLKFLIYKIRHSTKHNIGKYRHDAWFKDEEGNWWYGVAYGSHTSIIHCRRLKRKSRRMR